MKWAMFTVTLAVEVVTLWRFLNAAAPYIARWIQDRTPR